MTTPFIRNHQYNLMRKQAALIVSACNKVSDPKVVESLRYSAQSAVLAAFPDATEGQQQLLERMATVSTTEQFDHYFRSVEPFVTEFGPVTEKQLKKLFPKVKKLKVPELGSIDYRFVTYLGWTDIAANKLFLVYPLNGQFVGVEGKFTPTSKKNTCFLCNRHEEVALVTAIVKTKPAGASPDYYKAIGNYMCLNSDVCNKNITEVAALETFIGSIVGC